MCVHHDQTDMYDHLIEFCGASEHVRNNRGQTPMLLAASLGKVEVFQHIYNKRRRIAWAYGPVRVSLSWCSPPFSPSSYRQMTDTWLALSDAGDQLFPVAE